VRPIVDSSDSPWVMVSRRVQSGRPRSRRRTSSGIQAAVKSAVIRSIHPAAACCLALSVDASDEFLGGPAGEDLKVRVAVGDEVQEPLVGCRRRVVLGR